MKITLKTKDGHAIEVAYEAKHGTVQELLDLTVCGMLRALDGTTTAPEASTVDVLEEMPDLDLDLAADDEQLPPGWIRLHNDFAIHPRELVIVSRKDGVWRAHKPEVDEADIVGFTFGGGITYHGAMCEALGIELNTPGLARFIARSRVYDYAREEGVVVASAFEALIAYEEAQVEVESEDEGVISADRCATESAAGFCLRSAQHKGVCRFGLNGPLEPKTVDQDPAAESDDELDDESNDGSVC